MRPRTRQNRRSQTEPEKLESAMVMALMAGRAVQWGLALGSGVGFGNFIGYGVTDYL